MPSVVMVWLGASMALETEGGADPRGQLLLHSVASPHTTMDSSARPSSCLARPYAWCTIAADVAHGWRLPVTIAAARRKVRYVRDSVCSDTPELRATTRPRRFSIAGTS